MYLDNEKLRELIAKCLFGNKWENQLKCVIPRKGNFVNPEQLNKVDTFAVYYIAKREKKLVNFTGEEYNENNATVTHYATVVADVKIQFIGKKAEDWAVSTLFWDERTDIQNLLLEYDSQLMLGNRDIVAVPFQQEGLNGEMSYLASFTFVTNIKKEEIQQYLTDLIIFEGQLIVEK